MLRHNAPTLAALLCLALAAAGCADDPERAPKAQAVADVVNVVFHHGKWRQIPATPENQAEAIVFEQRVSFAGETASLDRAGHAAIDRLLSEAEPAPGSLVGLSVGGPGTEAAALDQLALRRLEAVRRAVVARGYEAALASVEAGRVAALDEGEIGLTVVKFTAVLPDCDQPQPLAPDPPAFTRGFGCSSAHNLGVMVADPADLERGRVLDPADAEAASLSILRYRVGETEPLEEESSKSQ